MGVGNEIRREGCGGRGRKRTCMPPILMCKQTQWLNNSISDSLCGSICVRVKVLGGVGDGEQTPNSNSTLIFSLFPSPTLIW